MNNTGMEDVGNKNLEVTGAIIPPKEDFKDIKSLTEPQKEPETFFSNRTNETSSLDSLPSADHPGVQYFPAFLSYLEQKLPFTVMLVAVIGYIIISAFGQMSSFLRGLGYISFLTLVYLFYQFNLPKTKLTIANILKRINRFFSLGFFILLAIIILSNWRYVGPFLSNFLWKNSQQSSATSTLVNSLVTSTISPIK